MSRDREREGQLAAIRATYARYRTSGRERLWDRANPGYRRLEHDRDRALVALLRASVSAGARVLDAGSGTGDLAGLVRSAGIDVAWTGVDLLPDAVSSAKATYPWASWVEGSVDQLPFDREDFDVVVAATLFSSLPTAEMRQTAAGEIRRVLRPGGWLIWYDLRYRSPSNPDVHAIDGDELQALFPEWRGELRTITLLPPLARRLGRLAAVLYPALHALPPARSHLVGRLRSPMN